MPNVTVEEIFFTVIKFEKFFRIELVVMFLFLSQKKMRELVEIAKSKGISTVEVCGAYIILYA